MSGHVSKFTGPALNDARLQQAQADFLSLYPGGFAHPDMQAIARKHKVQKMQDLVQQSFAPDAFVSDNAITAAMVKTVSSSSLVSVFEKPKFRDFVASADSHTHGMLANGLYEFLHGDQTRGFVALVRALAPAKLAKWSLVTLIPNYYHPDDEVFVKPTTAKGVIRQFELQVPDYRPMPYWDFYSAYRETILAMKAQCDPSLGVSNVAFCGFLMMNSR
tara:strand:- start:62861 stop:63514 length:654 start_codon:yes stop_codon:yes gene_type:complete